ncbi:MAG TPA: hypothetical protein PL009_08740, partial [Flavipsychrobacter sp.]|nr:hypothetical protein [Flavipsychrobacter sp.]
MKLFVHHLLLVTLLFTVFTGWSQTTVTTGSPASPTAGSGNTWLTFAIANNNSFGINVTDIEMFRSSTSNGNIFTLYYSSTSLSGTPTFPSAVWTSITSTTLSAITTTAIHPTFTGMNFTIPANTTYRFLVHSSGTSFNYGGSGSTPNSFTNGGVTIGTGSYQVNSQNVGYWGTTTPRFWGGSVTFVPAAPPCAAPTGATVSGITMTSANFNWNAVTGSQGYEYQITTSSTPPTTAGTPTTATSYNAPTLNVGTNYWFWVSNKCSTAVFSNWAMVAFSTSACPVAGTPLITNNVPGSVTFTWPGTSASGVLNYRWAVTPTAAILPFNSPLWTTTSSLTATDNALTAGSFYYIHVASNCGTNQSVYSPLQFQNPFTPCAQPSTISITGVNMHGADIKWTSSPNVVNGYQYALTTSATPPTTGIMLTTDTNFAATNLVGGQTYYFYVRTHCGTNNAVPPVSNIGVWKIDSFTTPLICGAASGATITNVTSKSADIVWTKYPGIYGYEYVINSNATPPPASFSGAAITFNNLAAGNLFSGTNYYFHLRIRCDTFNYSPWSSTPFNTQNICSSTPSAPTLIGITPTTAHFSWTGVPGALQYQYSVTPTNVPDPNSNTYTSQTNAKALLLNPNSPYYFHVRAYCSPNDLSNWESVPFSTVSVS